MKTSIAVLALALSLVSLGFQVQKAQPTARFDKFMGPASISDFDYRVMVANQQMIRNAIGLRNGIGVPFVKEVADDHQRLMAWVIVSEEDLPKGYDARKKALRSTAIGAVSVVAPKFDLGSEQMKDGAVSVEFWSVEKLAKEDKKPYAEYVKGELVIH